MQGVVETHDASTSCSWRADEGERPRESAVRSWMRTTLQKAHSEIAWYRRCDNSRWLAQAQPQQFVCHGKPWMHRVDDACALLHGRSTLDRPSLNETFVVTLIGDSTQRQFTTAIAALADAKPAPSCFRNAGREAAAALRDGINGLVDCWIACSGQLELRWIRSAHLAISGTKAVESMKSDRHGERMRWAWPGVVRGSDVVVLHAGAHYVSDATYTLNMEAARAFVVEHAASGAAVFFRSIHPGHASCMNATVPIATLAEAEERNQQTPWYEGANFGRQNAIAKAVFGRAPTAYLDTYAPTLMRADAHVGSGDCLHYCIPGGPHLLWVDLLVHAVACRGKANTMFNHLE